MTQLLPPSPAAASWSGRARQVYGSTPVGPALVAGAGVAVMVVLQLADPNEPGHYPTCPVLAVTGLFCPGCGSMRMLAHLGDGDVVAAASMNPLALLLLPVLLAYWLQWVLRTLTGRSRRPPARAWVVWAFAAVSVGYAVLRNLPGMEVLAPG